MSRRTVALKAYGEKSLWWGWALTLSLLAGATPSVACPGLTLREALVKVGARSGLQIAFNPARLGGRCAYGFVATDDAKADLLRLSRLSGLDLVTLRPGVFALMPQASPPPRPSARVPVEAPKGDTVALDEVVVVASKTGEETADLWMKRFSNQMVDRISAAQVARLPTGSAAEAARLAPGVQLDNQRGLGLYIYARGLDSNFHLIQLDGRSIAFNELIENGGPRGRSFRFEVLPTELVPQLEVIKTSSASDQEGAVGVTVNVRTSKPLEMGNRRTLSVQTTENALRGVPGGGVSGLISWRDQDGKLGIILSAVARNRFVRNDRFFEFQWTRDAFPSVLPSTDYTPGRVRPTIELEERTQKGMALTAQWRPSSASLTELNLLADRLDVHYDEYGLDIYPDDTSTSPPAFVVGSAQRVGDTVVAGRIDNVRWMASRETSLNRHDLIATGLRQTFATDRWTLVADASYSRAHSFHPDGQGTSRSRMAFFAPLIFDFSKGYRALPSLATTVDYNDPASYVGWTYNYAPKDSIDVDRSYRLDGEWSLDGPVIGLKAGALSQRRSRDYRRRDWFLDGLTGAALPARYASSLPFDDFLSDLSGSSPRRWVAPSATAFRETLFTPQVAAQPLTADDLAASYQVQETVFTTYLQADYAFMAWGAPISGDLGLRRPETRQISRGYASDGMVATPVVYRRAYAVWLPSFNVRAKLRPDLIARASLVRSLTRPNLNDIAPRITTSLDNETASGGNPDLRAFTATNLDAALEWYPGRSTLLSLTVFRKAMDNYITSQNLPLAVPGHGVLLLSTSVNGGRATVDGAELAFTSQIPAPHFGGRLSLSGSATATASRSNFMAGDREIRDRLSGLSHRSFTLTAAYARGPASASLGYFWRDRYLNSYGSSLVGEEYVAALGTLDGQIAYRLTDRLTVQVEASNLTDAKKYVFGVSEAQPKEINAFGRTVFFTLKWGGG